MRHGLFIVVESMTLLDLHSFCFPERNILVGGHRLDSGLKEVKANSDVNNTNGSNESYQYNRAYTVVGGGETQVGYVKHVGDVLL